MIHMVPSSCPSSAATSAWFNTTGKREVGRAQVNSPKSPRLLFRTSWYRKNKALRAWVWVPAATCFSAAICVR